MSITNDFFKWLSKMKSETEKYDLLVSLARRKYPGTNRWHSTLRHYLGDEGESRCLICERQFILIRDYDGYSDYTYSLNDINEHGLQHLKDSNLLPFL